MSGMWYFNIKDGYTEALCRGLRTGFLTGEDYRRLGLCTNLEDLRSAFETTDYGHFLQDEPTPLAVPTFTTKCKEKLAKEFAHLRSMAGYPLIRFLDFVAIEKMIDNVVGLIQGSVNKKSAEEMLGKIDPMGYFPEMRAIASMDLSTGYEELFRTVLIETPVGPYFEKFLRTSAIFEQGAGARGMTDVASMLNETDLEIMRSILKKAWLEAFYHFCVDELGGITGEVMGHILKCEADFMVLAVTLNTMSKTGSEQSQNMPAKDKLYPGFGYLYPEGTDRMRRAWNDTTVRSALLPFQKYLEMYEDCREYYVQEEVPIDDADDESSRGVVRQVTRRNLRSFEDILYSELVKTCELAFEEQMHYGVFYAWVKLREQEIRNITWIAEMIVMDRKEEVENILPIFAPRY